MAYELVHVTGNLNDWNDLVVTVIETYATMEAAERNGYEQGMLALQAGETEVEYRWLVRAEGAPVGCEFPIGKLYDEFHVEPAIFSGPTAPPPGSWAETAMLMAAGDDSGFDWDQWKDEMKDQSMGL